jgi:hypothetical protein
MRHLYRTGDALTICGLEACTRDSVHVSHARKSDCTNCRRNYRAQIWRERSDSMCFHCAHPRGQRSHGIGMYRCMVCGTQVFEVGVRS